MNFLNRCFSLLLCLSFVFSGQIFADDYAADSGTVTQLTKALTGSLKAAEKALERKSTEKYDRVTFEKVLQDPDNIELNLRYAQDQIERNDLLGAVATLERVLMVDSELAQVRLFYAVVLYRVGNHQEAKVEFDRLSELELPESVREEIDLYRKNIRHAEKRTRFTLRQTVGFGIDGNRNAAPSSKRLLFFDAPVGLTGTSRQRRDTHFLNITSFDVVHDLGTQAGHEVFASFAYFLQEQTNVDSLDLSSFQYEFGGTYKTDYFNFSPSFYASNMLLSRESFLRTQGGRFVLDKEFNERLRSSASFKVERQDYLPITENATARQRKGRMLEYDLTSSFALTPRMFLTGGASYTNKNAEEDFNAYERLGLQFSHTWLIGKGQFLINSFNLNFDYYDEPEVAIAGRFRKDKIFRYRLTYGAPLTTLLIGKVLPKFLGDIVATVSYEYYRSLSSITNYTYKNNKFQAMLTKKIEF